MRVGGATSQLELTSLTLWSIARCGRLQLGVPHWATSVDSCKKLIIDPTFGGSRFFTGRLLAIEDLSIPSAAVKIQSAAAVGSTPSAGLCVTRVLSLDCLISQGVERYVRPPVPPGGRKPRVHAARPASARAHRAPARGDGRSRQEAQEQGAVPRQGTDGLQRDIPHHATLKYLHLHAALGIEIFFKSRDCVSEAFICELRCVSLVGNGTYIGYERCFVK